MLDLKRWCELKLILLTSKSFPLLFWVWIMGRFCFGIKHKEQVTIRGMNFVWFCFSIRPRRCIKFWKVCTSLKNVCKLAELSNLENSTTATQIQPSKKRPFSLWAFFQPSALLHDPLEHRKLIYPFFSRGFMICLAFMRFITASNCRIDLRPDFITY